LTARLSRRRTVSPLARASADLTSPLTLFTLDEPGRALPPGRFPATILGDLRNTIANYNWIRDLADFLDAPFENFANANYLPLPQDNDEVRPTEQRGPARPPPGRRLCCRRALHPAARAAAG
jgi:hypothetical protein